MVPVVAGVFVGKQMRGLAQEFVDPPLSSHRKLEACYYKARIVVGASILACGPGHRIASWKLATTRVPRIVVAGISEL